MVLFFWATCTPCCSSICMYILGASIGLEYVTNVASYQFCFSCFTYLFYVVLSHFQFFFFQGNRKSAGFTNEERESFETNFLSKGFVDTFRKQHPSVVAYSYWGYRHNARKTNKGMYYDRWYGLCHLLLCVYDFMCCFIRTLKIMCHLQTYLGF